MSNLGFLGCFSAIAELNVLSSLLESEASLAVVVIYYSFFSHLSDVMQSLVRRSESEL